MKDVTGRQCGWFPSSGTLHDYNLKIMCSNCRFKLQQAKTAPSLGKMSFTSNMTYDHNDHPKLQKKVCSFNGEHIKKKHGGWCHGIVSFCLGCWLPTWALVQVLADSLLIQIPVYGLGRLQRTAQVLGPCIHIEVAEASGSCLHISSAPTIVNGRYICFSL